MTTESAFRRDALHDEIATRVDWRAPAIVIASSALVALCAHISVPLGFTPVPVTMQTFAVLLLGLLLTPRMAFAALIVYLIEGAAGLPVFSPHGPGGIVHLLGPTGGYLLAYPFAAALASLIFRRGNRRFLFAILAAAAAGIGILASGAAWLWIFSHASFSLVFAQSVAPFLPGDAAKIVFAAACATMLHSFEKPPCDSSR